MALACIDIGSNTTRLLVADCREGRLRELASQRAFTRIGKAVRQHGRVPTDKVVETGEVVARQARVARELGARQIAVVATAAVRAAPNRDEVGEAVRRAAGLEMEVLSDEEEARLAFVGATKTLPTPVEGSIAVIDIGGGSTEVAVGATSDGVSWWTSVALGSGVLTDAHLHSDPPTPDELRAARDEVTRTFEGLEPPAAERSVAVGGSARSVRKLVGQELSAGTVARALALLASTPAEAVAERFDMTLERAPLLPAGALILDGLLRHLGPRIAVGQGGVREGVILELDGGRRAAGEGPPSGLDGGRALASATTSEP
jgi:exopolyphosphatase / guanosine-5'-triphosphate,3'-diphosphate pyrophosphatase